MGPDIHVSSIVAGEEVLEMELEKQSHEQGEELSGSPCSVLRCIWAGTTCSGPTSVSGYTPGPSPCKFMPRL